MSERTVTYPCTIGDIVRLTGEDLHRVEYAIRSRRIQPVRRLGNINLYDVGGVEQVKAALAAIQQANARRAARAPMAAVA